MTLYVLKKRLIIELDGSQHNEDTDKERTNDLESKGFKILRFWNNEVLQNVEGVLEKIFEEFTLAPSPVPLPSWEKNNRKGDQ